MAVCVGVQECKRKLLHLLYSNRLVVDLVIISLSLEGEDRVKQNQANLSSGNYAAYRYPITNSYGPLDFFLNYDSSSLGHCWSFPTINLQHQYCGSFIDLKLLIMFLNFEQQSGTVRSHNIYRWL